MPGRSYPLEAVRALREQEMKGAQMALVRARAELARVEAVRDGVQHEVRVQGERRAEVARFHATSGAELARAGAYAARLEHEHAEKERARRRAEAGVNESRRALRKAELELLHAHQGRELIERHHERFAAEQKKLAERKAELELDDQLRSRLPRRG